MSYGFIRVAAAVPSLRVADCAYNVEQMLPLIAEAENNNVDVPDVKSNKKNFALLNS